MTLGLRKTRILESLGRQDVGLRWLSSLQLESAPPSSGAAVLLREQAWIEEGRGLYAEADTHLARALAMAQTVGGGELAATIQIRRAFTLVKLGRANQADQSLDDAESYLREHKSSALEAYIPRYRGLVRLLSDRFEEALPYFERALRLARDANSRSEVANESVNLAWCHYRLGQLDRAAELYNQALPLALPEERHLILGHLGNIFHDRHAYAQAADHYRQAADLARGQDQEYYSVWLSNLATTLCDEGKWDEAERVNQQALAVKKTIQRAKGVSFEMLNAARIAASRGRTDAAESLYRQLASSSANDPAAVLEADSRLAQLYAQTGQPEEARKQFETALATADQRRASLQNDENKLSYLAYLIDLHQHYVEFLAARGEWESAFAVAESSRARVLRERLGVAQTPAGHRRIADYQAAARAAKVTFLSYWIAPEKSYLWEITGARFRTIPLPGESEIRALVEHYQAGLEKDRLLDLKSGARLFDLLLGQVASTPGGRYVIVPDGPLYGLNLETLPAGADGHYWLEDATVMLTPSLDLLLARGNQARRNRRLLLVGDADEWDDEFPKLPSAEQEIESIEKSFPEKDREVLSGPSASPAGYQRAHPERFGYIHFDAHAAANRDAPMDSAIVLSREGDRGRLTVKDLLGMHTQAELVTLSACHSAGARTYAGEGMVGLAWAFLQSGAGSVIAGLWDVSDYSSPRLMEQLYAGLAKGEAPAEALRAAKLALIHGGKYVHPFYWGAFQLYAGARQQGSPL
ncbi:MAG TPA: CHAT domain-containing protein [Bryobacteraceae bacterium]|nr:CHAT domain-containing protein [Bryobacteraceae bacterium]